MSSSVEINQLSEILSNLPEPLTVGEMVVFSWNPEYLLLAFKDNDLLVSLEDFSGLIQAVLKLATSEQSQ